MINIKINLISLRSMATVVICLFSFVSRGQSEAPVMNPIPNVTFPSPQAESIQRFGDYPVNFGTGLPEIKIPVYEIKSGSLTLPISFSFHAAGCKVNQSFSLLGQDWTVDAGGVLSRIIRDKPDDYYTFANKTVADIDGILNTGSFPYSQVTQIINNEDKQYDIFSFQSNTGLSGKFYLQHSGTNGQTLTPKHLISSPVQLGTPTIATSPNRRITAFRLIGEDGTIYVFGASGVYGYNENTTELPVHTGWWLAHIISPDLKDSISFKYEQYQQLVQNYSEQVVLNDGFNGATPDPSYVAPYHFGTPQLKQSPILSHYSTVYINEIHFKGGKVNFDTRMQGEVKVLSKLTVSSSDGTVIKSIVPYITNFSNLNNTVAQTFVKVDSLAFVSPVDQAIRHSYKFEYYNNTNIGFPVGGNVGPNSKLSKDLGGFFNGNSGSLVPSFLSLSGWSGGDRRPSPTHAMQGMLKKITFPTRGATEFIYEGNRANSNYTNGSNADYAPGLRISRQINYTGSDVIGSQKSYEYDIGVMPVTPHLENFGYKTYALFRYLLQGGGLRDATYRQQVINSEFVSDIGSLISRAVRYPKITEYEGTIENNNGKTEYLYNTYSNGVVYPISTDIPSSFTISPNQCGSLGGAFSLSNPGLMLSPRKVIHRPHVSNELSSKTVYAKSGSTYVPAYSLSRTFQLYNQSTLLELFIGQYINVIGEYIDGIDIMSECLMGELSAGGYTRGFFYLDNTEFEVAFRKQDSETETFYVNGTPSFTKTTEFKFENTVHQQVTKTIVTRSDGNKEVTHLTYPSDYINGTTFIDNMKAKNLQAYPIEQVKYKEVGTTRTILSGNIFTYKTGGNGLIDQSMELETAGPIALSSFKFSHRPQGQLPNPADSGAYAPDTRYKPRVGYTYDTENNPSQITPVSGPSTSYIWGYNGIYPIAESKNAIQSDIAYADFESDGKGNWTYSGATAADISAPSGKRTYSLGGGALSKNGLNSAGSYLLTYWSMWGVPTVSGSSGSTVSAATVMQTKGTIWTQYRRVISGATSVSLGGSVPVDDVRLHPIEAQMETYTYDPLVGMTMSTDASGNVFYYEYDEFGRLKLVRDLKGNRKEEYKYNYRNQ